MLPHSFDLRIVLACYDGLTHIVGVLARVAEKSERIAKNTARGSMPIGIFDIPQHYRDAITKIYLPYSFIGLDVIPYSEDASIHEKIYSLALKLYDVWVGLLDRRKRIVISLERDYYDYLDYLKKIYDEYRLNPIYSQLQDLLQRSLSTSVPYLVEINDRPDFGYNTRLLALPNGDEIMQHIAKIIALQY